MQFSLPSFLLSILFGGLFLVASFIHYKNKYKVTYSVRNMFPYELNYKSRFADNFYGNTALILTILGFAFFFSTFDLNFHNGFFITALISGVLASILFLILAFVPLDHIRVHSSIFILFIIFSFLLPSSICVGSFVYNQYLMSISESTPIPLIVFGLSLVMTIVTLALLLNPKLTLNLRMKKVVSEDGTIKYIRPNVLTLAFTEWLLFFFLYINELLIFILTFAF
ncbi:MAG: hypothetical protein H6688_01915 [Erysipelotrichaceae bacterium]|nr:hypothetical protein [Erysipelotrichaceae bacterium]